MRRLLICTLNCLLLFGCGSSETTDDQQTGTQTDENAETLAMSPLPPVSGKEAYLEHCAGCHDTGISGAPVVGDHSYWDKRSKLWQAVLMDHAKTGYLNMPAKGGRPDLPDRTIDAAVEYMLEITYPNSPADQ